MYMFLLSKVLFYHQVICSSYPAATGRKLHGFFNFAFVKILSIKIQLLFSFYEAFNDGLNSLNSKI